MLMPSLRERGEHPARHAGVAAHPDADDRDLGHAVVGHDALGADLRGDAGEHALGALPVAARQREGDVRQAVAADVLHDHVDDDVLAAERAEHLRGDARAVGHAQDRHLGLGPVVGDAGDHDVFHAVVLPRHERARVRLERRADVDRHAELLGELDGAGLQHLGAEARHLEHLVVGHARELPRVRHDVGIGGVDAVDVGEDLAHVRLEGGGERDAGEVRAAAAERGDVAGLRHRPGSPRPRRSSRRPSAALMRSAVMRQMRALVCAASVIDARPAAR